MPEPFGALDLVEIVALMLEGVIEAPCKHSTHIPWVWFGDRRPADLRRLPSPGVGRS